MQTGRYVGGVAAIGLGGVILWWGDFARAWERVPASVPAHSPLAYLTGAVLVAVGLCLFWRGLARWGALGAAAVFAGFAALIVREILQKPDIFDSWGSLAEQTSIVAGFLATYAVLSPARGEGAARLAYGARVWFGICAIIFGAVHFVYLKPCADFVPKWVPLGGVFWSLATGMFHAAAGVGVMSGILARLAARLAALMYLGFGLIAWGAMLAAHPSVEFTWGGEAVNFTLVAAAWMIGESLKAFPSQDGKLFAFGRA